MLIRSIVRSVGITAAALGLYACTPKYPNKNTEQYHFEDMADSCPVPKIKPAPLTHDFLGLRVEYKSKEDSIKATDYIKKIVAEALPVEKQYDEGFDEIVRLNAEITNMFCNDSNEKNIKKKYEQYVKQENYMDSLWDILKNKLVPSDSINQYAKHSDLQPHTDYLYDWFKEQVKCK